MRKLLLATLIGGMMSTGLGLVLPAAHASSTCEVPWPPTPAGGYPVTAGQTAGGAVQACVHTGTQDGTVTVAGTSVAADGEPGDAAQGYVAVDDTGAYGCWTGDYAYGDPGNNSLAGAPDPASPCAPQPPS